MQKKNNSDSSQQPESKAQSPSDSQNSHKRKKERQETKQDDQSYDFDSSQRIFNIPNFVREGTAQTEQALKAGGASARDDWNVMQPVAISKDMWDETYRVYIEDKHDLKMREYFEENNPYALQDMTAVMLETARKGYWSPEKEVLQRLAEVHTELLAEYGAACSYETCGNQAFHKFLNQQLNAPGNETSPQTLSDYQLALSSALQPTQSLPEVEGIEMSEVREEMIETENFPDRNPALVILLCFVFLSIGFCSSILRAQNETESLK
ncbi:cobaltochelatase subunit CobN [uncultured Gimesia sp.]|uniref:cobaltochelatase subunit CobN n=1 Tax=uncultured Gimesia sp. TaxID=1678688 RepID=UPI0030DD52C3|tara:strand:+ start:66453 stop:67250 length:798 start_codon:yes stop_codon:yes gene_type:complete